MSSRTRPAPGQRTVEIFKAVRENRAAILGVGVFSGIVNVLALTGALYMLQVYDRVLSSRSIETLVGLTLLMVALLAFYGLFDMLRSRLLGQLATKFDRSLRAPVFAAVMELPLRVRTSRGDPMQPMRDLDQIRGFMSGPGPTAFFDAPWLPLYLALVFFLHVWLGLLATAGALILIGLTVITEFKSRKPSLEMTQATQAREMYGRDISRNLESVQAHGAARRLTSRWAQLSEALLGTSAQANRVTGGLGAFSRSFRLILQSAMLGFGALLVIRGEVSGGYIIAGSILTARALAPLEIAIANWRGFVAARQAADRLRQILQVLSGGTDRLSLPRPTQTLSVQGLFVAPPGEQRPIIQNATFALQRGTALGIIGPSASGKTSLVRSLVGVWGAMRGSIRLDGASLDQYSAAALGRDIGYVPQDIELFDATIAQNIARCAEQFDMDAVIAAAHVAGVHELIEQLPRGYDTPAGDSGGALSAGQRQRIALACALYGDPFLVVLDEPNSNLDVEGDLALARAITAVKARGGIVIAVAHRPTVLSALDKLMVMGSGQIQMFGPKNEVLAKLQEQTAPPGGPAPPAKPNGKPRST